MMTFARGQLRLFLGCTSLTALADAAIRFGVSWHILQTTGSAGLFTLVYGLSIVVDAFGRPLLSPVADYFDRRKVFRWTSALSAALSSALVLAVACGVAPLAVLVTLLLALAAISGLREPTASALMAELAQPSEQAHARAAQLTVQSAVSLLGVALTGWLVATTGPVLALGAAAGCEVAAWLGALRLRATPLAPSSDGGGRPSVPSWSAYRRSMGSRIWAGLQCLWKVKAERTTILAGMCTNTALVCLLTLVIPVWVAKGLQGSAALMGALEASISCGFLLGSSVVVGHANRWLGRDRCVVIGPLVFAACLAAATLTRSEMVLCGLLALAGCGLPLYVVNAGALRALATPDAFRARLMGGAGFVVNGLMPVILPVFGAILELAPAVVGVALCAVLMLMGSLVMLANRPARELLRMPDDELLGKYAVDYPAAFQRSGA